MTQDVKRSAARQAVVLIGHSHLNAVRHGFEARKARGDVAANGAAYFLHDVWRHQTHYADSAPGGGVAFNPQVLDLIDATIGPSAPRRYVAALGGNAHIVLGLTRNPRPFDFVLPERPDLPLEPGAELTPYAMFCAALKTAMMSYVWQMVALRQAVGEFICLETPPPSGDDAYVVAHLGGYAPDPSNIVSRAMRYKIWRAHSALLAEFCAGIGARFLAVPPEAQDAEGFLRPECHGNDATHANAFYGELVSRQIERALDLPLHDFVSFA